MHGIRSKCEFVIIIDHQSGPVPVDICQSLCEELLCLKSPVTAKDSVTATAPELTSEKC